MSQIDPMSQATDNGSTTDVRIGKPLFQIDELRSSSGLSDFIHRVGHEMSNPLTSVISLATILPKLVDDIQHRPEGETKLPQYANSILDESWRLNALVQRLVLLLSDRAGSISAYHPVDLLTKAVEKQKRYRRAPELKFFIDHPPQISHVAVDTEQCGALLQELCQNAIDSVLEQRCVWSDVGESLLTGAPIRVVIKEEAQRVVFSFETAVKKPTAEDLNLLFEPFVSAWPGSKHVGLGLTVSYAIAARFGGELHVEEILDGNRLLFRTVLALPCSNR